MIYFKYIVLKEKTMPKDRASKLMTISLPVSLYRQAEKAAKDEGRTKSELARECIRKYLHSKKWDALLWYGRQRAAETGLRAEEIEDIVHDTRRHKS